MTCCGNIIETTDNSDRTRQYFCQECGKQGPAEMFSEPVVAGEPPTRIERARLAVAETLDALAAWIAPR